MGRVPPRMAGDLGPCVGSAPPGALPPRKPGEPTDALGGPAQPRALVTVARPRRSQARHCGSHRSSCLLAPGEQRRGWVATRRGACRVTRAPQKSGCVGTGALLTPPESVSVVQRSLVSTLGDSSTFSLVIFLWALLGFLSPAHE